MASSKSVDKASRAAGRKRLRNRLVRSRTGTSISKVRSLVSSGKLELARQETSKVVSNIDRAVSKGVIHKNKGANLKSRLARALNTAGERGKSRGSGEGETE